MQIQPEIESCLLQSLSRLLAATQRTKMIYSSSDLSYIKRHKEQKKKAQNRLFPEQPYH